MFTNYTEDLGGGDGVKVGELIADLAPEHSARVQRDGAQSDQAGPAGRFLNRLYHQEKRNYRMGKRHEVNNP